MSARPKVYMSEKRDFGYFIVRVIHLTARSSDVQHSSGAMTVSFFQTCTRCKRWIEVRCKSWCTIPQATTARSARSGTLVRLRHIIFSMDEEQIQFDSIICESAILSMHHRFSLVGAHPDLLHRLLRACKTFGGRFEALWELS